MPLKPDEQQRIERYIRDLRARGEDCVAIFDLGTKAARLLLAPRHSPAEWERSAFYTLSRVPALGDHLDAERRLDTEARPVREVVGFLNDAREALIAAGVAPHDIAATGTAVFRWLSNQTEVLQTIKSGAGIDVFVLDERAEAYLSLFAVSHTYRLRARGLPPRLDAVLLLDQGGGSLEVSYVPVSPESGLNSERLFSFDKLGAMYLQERFFNLAGGKLVAPGENRMRVSKQRRKIVIDVQERVRDWEGFPELAGKNLAAYGMGTALTYCFANVSGYRLHNRGIGTKEIWSRVEGIGRRLEKDREQVCGLYAKRGELPPHDLTMLCGLPAYVSVLNKLNLKYIRAAGYGLRFGAYLWRFSHGRPFEALAAAIPG